MKNFKVNIHFLKSDRVQFNNTPYSLREQAIELIKEKTDRRFIILSEKTKEDPLEPNADVYLYHVEFGIEDVEEETNE